MIVIGHNQLARLARHVTEAAEADLYPMLDAIGQTIEDNARRRIFESKREPNGKRWKPWSERYAKTRKSHHSLLQDTGALADSLTHTVDGKEVVVGSNLVYAATHQWGDEERKIPARPYLSGEGFEDESEREELRDVLREFLGSVL